MTNAARNPEFEMTTQQFRFLSDLAYRRTGIVLAEQKRQMVYGRLVRRLRALNLQNFNDYCTLLESPQGNDEMGELVNAITTNLTGFFREAHHFEHLKEVLTDDVASGKKRLRLWSAACSSGMEPYSMAMVLRHVLGNTKHIDARILATDIDTLMVQTGATGAYRTDNVEKVPQTYQKYISYDANGTVQMKEDISQLIRFRQLNLLENWPMKGPFDVIFCRNVVIYFDKPTKIKLFARMAELLPLGGYLYIGHSENLHGITDRFELVGRTIYRRVK